MYEISRLTKPQLVRCGNDWVVDVPAGRTAEAIEFSRRNDSRGFKLNAFTGATQQTIDAVLSTEHPSVLVVAGNLAVSKLGAPLKKLVLGIGTAWPDSLPQSEVEIFSCMKSQSADLLPQKIKELSMHGFAAKDFSSFRRFQQLTTVRLTEARNLESLDGLPPKLAHLDLVKCRKLRDINALRHSHVQHFSAERCPLLTKRAIEEAQNWLLHRSNSV